MSCGDVVYMINGVQICYACNTVTVSPYLHGWRS
jgi:hypothetical protein